jgi:tetrahydromethanopterin S-methyltransferase subunit B
MNETDKIKKHVDSQARQLKKDFMADNGEIKAQVQAVNQLVEDLRKIMNSRVSKLELSEARREGRESASVAQPVNWNKIILGIIGLATAAIGLAYILAQNIGKGG